jgi:hypothetical protein
MREFTWWRRFHGVRKLPKRWLYKGASELLQRIEFGEYEFNHLGREVYLEDKIFEEKRRKIKQESPWLKGEALKEKLEYDHSQLNKRKSAIMKAHLAAEEKLLIKLTHDLSSEFKLDSEQVSEIMEEFTGNTRELYFKCKSIAEDIYINPDKTQRFIREQPRHILKPKERKYMPLWVDLIKQQGWQRYLNWDVYGNL